MKFRIPFLSKNIDDRDQSENNFFETLFATISRGLAFLIPDNFDAYIDKGYVGNPDVYSILGKAEKIGLQAEFKLMRRNSDGSVEEVTDPGHELNKLKKNPNPGANFEQFYCGTHTYKQTIGNAYWYKPIISSGVNSGKSNEIFVMPSQNIEVIQGENWMMPIGGYKFRDGTQKEPFTNDEVYHLKYFNPEYKDTEYGIYGLSPIKVAAQLISKQNQSDLSEQRAFENEGPPYIVSKDGAPGSKDWTNDQKLALKREYKKRVKGDNKGLPWFLSQSIKTHILGISPSDLNIIESSKYGLRRLCNIWGLPAELMNLPEGSTYNNVNEAKKSAWSDSIIPFQKDFAESWNQFLIAPVDDYNGLFFEWDYSKVQELQEDRKVLIDTMIIAGATRNETRPIMNLDPIDNAIMNTPANLTLQSVSFEDLEVEPLGEGSEEESAKQAKIAGYK